MNLIYLSNDPRGFVYQILSLISENKNVNFINNTNKAIMFANENFTVKNILPLDEKKKERVIISDFFLTEGNKFSIFAVDFENFKELVKQDFFQLSVGAVDGFIVDFEEDSEVSTFNYLQTTFDFIKEYLTKEKIFFILKNKTLNKLDIEINDIEDYLNFFELTVSNFIENLGFLDNLQPINKNVTLKRFDEEKRSILNKSVSPSEKNTLTEKYIKILKDIRSSNITDKDRLEELKKEAFETIEELRTIDRLSFYKSLIVQEFNNFKKFVAQLEEGNKPQNESNEQDINKFEKVDVNVETDY